MSTGNSEPTNRYWLCPLYYFDCDCESTDLAEEIQIKRIAPGFTTYLRTRCSDWFFWSDPSDTKYVAVFPQSIGASDRPRSVITGRDAADLLVDLISALRLCHAGAVTPGPLVSAEIQNLKFFIFSDDYSVLTHGDSYDFSDILAGAGVGLILTHMSEYGAVPFPPPKYEFRQSDVPQISELVKNLTQLRGKEEPDSLSITLRRFNSAYHGELEDRLLDQMIAFESLYIGDDKELTYKLALRTAFLLGRKRAKIFNDIRKAYALRGQIVHGNKQVDSFKLEEIIPKTENYLRQSIRRFLLLLSQGNSLKEIRENLLDENILKNGKPLALKE